MLSTQLSVQCHSGKTAPCGMRRGSAVTDHRFAYFAPDGSNTVYKYEWMTEKWKKLPSCPYHKCALAFIAGELTALGGGKRRMYSHSYSNKLFTLRRKKWVEEYPPMNIARSSPAVVSTCDGDYIIAIGGCTAGGEWTAAVELFQVKTRRWYEVMKLPQPLSCPSATLWGDHVHVISDGYSGYSSSLKDLPPSNRPITSRSPSGLLSWDPLPHLPVAESTAATLSGQLVVIGGRQGGPVNFIHQLVKEEWLEIGSMASGRYYCLLVSPSPDKLMIVGGVDSAYMVSNNVEECTCSIAQMLSATLNPF